MIRFLATVAIIVLSIKWAGTVRADQPDKDLKQRGLLRDTLLAFCTEFGRTPWAQDGKGTKGRSHHPSAFSCWLAGGGVRSGTVHGRTDDIGHRVAEDLVHIHDFHATILHIMGFDHKKLTFRRAGRDFRLTDIHGNVVKEIVA
jgi:arylsulfatase A-like enzyme